jgi:integrase
MVRQHIALHGIGPGQVIFPVRQWSPAYTPYQVRHTHASWLIDQGVDLARVQYRLDHGDLQATTRYVKILDEEDPKAADVIPAILGDVA